MKTDRSSLFWGTIIGTAPVLAIVVVETKFPNFRLPFTSEQAEMSLVSLFFFAILIAAYRKLWKAVSFWALLLALLGAHVTLYWFFVAKVTEEFGGFRMDILYGVVSGVEFAVFAIIVARLYHRGPQIPSWLSGAR